MTRLQIRQIQSVYNFLWNQRNVSISEPYTLQQGGTSFLTCRAIFSRIKVSRPVGLNKYMYNKVIAKSKQLKNPYKIDDD